MRLFRKSSAVAGIVAAALMVGGTVPANAAPRTSAVHQYESYLRAQSSTNPDAATNLVAFARLSPAKQSSFVAALADPRLLDELTSLASTRPDGAVTVASQARAGVVFQGIASGTAKSVLKAYPSYSTQTGRWSWTESLFGLSITRLNVWVTFNTGYDGVPDKALSSGSSSSNLNLLVNVSSTDHTPYIQKPAGLAVASTTWHGCALFKGLGACFDKVQTAKFFAGGLYSGTVVNA